MVTAPITTTVKKMIFRPAVVQQKHYLESNKKPLFKINETIPLRNNNRNQLDFKATKCNFINIVSI